MKHKRAILGGTFDHFHSGHGHFIGSAIDKCEFLTIGLTVDDFSKDKPFANTIEPYSVREKNVFNFLVEKGFKSKSQIVPISNPFGTSLTDKTIDAIFVTNHGLANAELINTKRNTAGITELIIENVPFLFDKSGEIISSTRIRAGEIDRKGNLYLELFSSTLLLPENLRSEVKILGNTKRSLGEIKEDLEKAQLIVAVGDVVSENLIKIGRQADVSIIDGKIQREIASSPPLLAMTSFTAENHAGTIQKDACQIIKQAIDENLNTGKLQVVKIDGEEDLLAIPAILLPPLGSLVIYGLPNQGIVVVKITEEKKKEISEIVNKFDHHL